MLHILQLASVSMVSGPIDSIPSMGPETSAEGMGLTDPDRETLRAVARESIQFGLEKGRPLEPDLDSISPALQRWGAAFVTLNLHGNLRGCVGSFEPRRPLLEDVAQNAYSAAFKDFRFSPLSREEFSHIELHISLLTPLEPMGVESRQDLLNKIRPGVDGLLLEDSPHRATFLPQVWRSLEDPEEFLGELFQKAGLRRDYWSETLKVYRYFVEEF